jgi:CBS domain-containing protein
MPSQTRVSDIMTTDVVTFTRDTSVEDAVQALAARKITGAPVVDDDGRLVGLLDDSDLILSEARIPAPSAIEILGAYIPLPGALDRFRDEVQHALARTVGEAMDDDPPSVGTDAIVEDVATIMLRRHVSRVPVVDADGRVVGIVSRGDLVAALGRR